VKASAACEDVSEAAVGEGPADVAAAATGGTVVEVLGAQVVVVVVLDGAVVVVEEESVEVVLVVSATCGTAVVVVLVLVELVELEELVEVDVDGLEVEELVVVVAEHGAVVVVDDGTVEVVLVLVGVVVLVDVLVVEGSTANPVGAVDPIVVAAVAGLPADNMAERTADPNRTFINRTDQRGIRQSFPPPASAPVRMAAAVGSEVCNRDSRW
jgi:hypothetical protein